MADNIRETPFLIRDMSGEVIAMHVKKEDLDRPILGQPGKFEKVGYPWYLPDGTPGMPDGLTPQDLFFGLETLSRSDSVFLVEGESAAQALHTLGLAAVSTTSGAAGVPRQHLLQHLSGKTVYLWPDNDPGGREHMRKTAERMHELGMTPYIVEWKDAPNKGDAADLAKSHNGTASMVVGQLTKDAILYQRPDDPHAPQALGGLGLHHAYAQEIDAIEESKRLGVPRTIATGFRTLDSLMDGGFWPEDLILLHAGAGVGKTAFVINLAVQCGVPALIVTTEMSQREMTRRLLAIITGDPRNTFLRGARDPMDEKEMVRRELAKYPNLEIAEVITKVAPMKWIRESMEKLKERSENGRALLIIDSWHSWIEGIISDDPSADERKALAKGLKEINGLAKSLGIVAIMVAERNMSSMTKAGKDTGANAIRGTGRGSYGPDVIIGLDAEHSDAEYIPGQQKSVILRFNKNRQGPPNAMVKYLFDGSTMRFSEVG